MARATKVLLLSLLVAIVCTKSYDGYDYKTYYFKQKVDHFGYCNGDHFLQRYLIASQYWDENYGPVFFYTGNEGDITMFANNTGFMWEHAPYFKALLVFAEHRYYGQSLPYGNESLNTAQKRGYLTSEQALADYATLIYYLKSSLPAEKNAFVAFGGSYGGMLAAWMRIKYPHLVAGAIASSAPVLQFSGLTDCESFAQIVTNEFDHHGPNCTALIRKSWSTIRNIAETRTGAKWLSLIFNLCEKLEPSDVDQLINWLQDTWNFLAMLNYPYPTHFLTPLPANPIKEACKYLNDLTELHESFLINIFRAASVFQNYTGNVKCFNLSESAGPLLGNQAWDYQGCTEMVMPMCQNGVNDMFEPQAWDLEKFSKQCEQRWQVKPDSFKAIIMYGGKNITAASNIFFSNGKMDPWSSGGIMQSLSDTIIAYVMHGAAHHLDLRASNPADPHSVIRARSAEVYWIKKWVS